jgi:hypothetical protein
MVAFFRKEIVYSLHFDLVYFSELSNRRGAHERAARSPPPAFPLFRWALGLGWAPGRKRPKGVYIARL